MDFARLLTQPDARSHATATMFLASQGAEGHRYLELALRRCKELDLDRDLDKWENRLFQSGTRALGTIVRAVGYDDANELHRDVVDWICCVTQSTIPKVRWIGTWGLGDIGIPPQIVADRLAELAHEDLLPDDLHFSTCRGTAFQMLSCVDWDTAVDLIGTPACDDYISALKSRRRAILGKPQIDSHKLAGIDTELRRLLTGE